MNISWDIWSGSWPRCSLCSESTNRASHCVLDDRLVAKHFTVERCTASEHLNSSSAIHSLHLAPPTTKMNGKTSSTSQSATLSSALLTTVRTPLISQTSLFWTAENTPGKHPTKFPFNVDVDAWMKHFSFWSGRCIWTKYVTEYHKKYRKIMFDEKNMTESIGNSWNDHLDLSTARILRTSG